LHSGSCVRPVFGRGDPSGGKVTVKCTCQPRRLAVVSKLPIKRLKRAAREAIEIAGTGQSALAAEQGSFAATFITSPCTCGGYFHRKGITRGKHRPHRIDSDNRIQRAGGTPLEFLRGGRHRGIGAILPGFGADCAMRSLAAVWAVCLMSSSDQVAGRDSLVRLRTGGRPRKFSGGNRAAERKNAMHQTAHCQEVNA
jgi:hypothetical protein